MEVLWNATQLDTGLLKYNIQSVIIRSTQSNIRVCSRLRILSPAFSIEAWSKEELIMDRLMD